ncbi:hypothetical protein AALA98_13445 [Lachnospiraceae bacterium 45-W7]
MKKITRNLLLLSAVSILTVGSAATVTAADYQTPAQTVASLTGRPVSEVIQEAIDSGKTYGMIAAEAGKLEEFKEERLNVKEQILDENVENGTISQEEADNILEDIKERQAICDGTGAGYGCGYGRGAGYGRGRGGCGYGRGACIY